MPFNTVEKAITAIKNGEMIILVDDEERENEGDLMIAAEKTTPEAINFMAKHGRGLICLSLNPKQVEKLELPMMVQDNDNTSNFQTAFTISIDAKHGTTTGISAADRAKTILVAIDPNYKKGNLVQPGHVFPLKAREGGVLVRSGQTEGSVDLAQMAGLNPSGVICEIMNEDGSMSRVPQLKKFALNHKIKMVSVKSLIEFRMKRESLISRAAETSIPTDYGKFKTIAYKNILDDQVHIALYLGKITKDKDILVRVHSQCLTGDVFGSHRCDCGEQLQKSMEIISKEGTGVILYLYQEGRGIGIVNKLKAYSLQDQGMDTVQANEALGFSPDLREYGIGAQILVDLGLGRVRLLTNNPKKLVGLEGYGLHVVEMLPIEIKPKNHNIKYLRTKKNKLGHLMKNI